MIKEVKKCGDSGHIILPKKYIGKQIKLDIPEIEAEEFLNRKEITELIKEKIESEKRGY